MSFFDKLRKGVKYMAMAFEKDELTTERIKYLIDKHKGSKTLQWMLAGERYYAVENDAVSSVRPDIKPYQADNRLIHATYKNLVDEKIRYLLSKAPSVKAESDEVLNILLDQLGDDYDYDLESLGYEASNKGVAWAHPHIGADGKFKVFIAFSEQVIPGWTDASHTGLDYLIRYYDTVVWRFGREVVITNVEVWTLDGVSYYRMDNGQLLKVEDREGHFQKDGKPQAWSKIPWIAFKNNRRELPDLKFVKKLVDNYDLSRSDVANYIQEVRNLIFILKGYNGDSIDQFLQEVYVKRAVVLDADDEGGGVDTINPTIDITAAKEHFERLKRDIVESGQGVNRDLDKFGSAPSGVALEFLFSGLELKGNQLEGEFKRGFRQLVEFVYEYLDIINKPIQREKVTIIFNRDMSMDEAGIIESCNASRGLVSEDTILANHPWVESISEEKEKLEKERQASGMMFNLAPKIKVVEDEQRKE